MRWGLVDDHHTSEDWRWCSGRRLIRPGRTAKNRPVWQNVLPEDEALARVCVDLSGRPSPVISLGLQRERIGDCDRELTHVMQSLSVALRLAASTLRSKNVITEPKAFKALALALRQALTRTGGRSRARRA